MRIAHWSTLAGLGVWVVALAWYGPPLAVSLLLLGPLVVAPLVLGLVWPPRSGRDPLLRLPLMQFPAAAFVALSFSMEAGQTAALWTLPWLAFAAALAFVALRRALRHRFLPLSELAIDAALGFLLVGAFWLTISRGGTPFLGFGEPIAFLTAAHFHFAGLVLPFLGGLAARALPGKASQAVCATLVAGMPLVAAGITLQEKHGNPSVNVIAVTVLTTAALGVILLQARLAARPGPILPRILWGISAASLPVGMALASLFVYGNAFGAPLLTIDQMVRTHAVVNVFGFALPGLVAWTLAPNLASDPADQQAPEEP